MVGLKLGGWPVAELAVEGRARRARTLPASQVSSSADTTRVQSAPDNRRHGTRGTVPWKASIGGRVGGSDLEDLLDFGALGTVVLPVALFHG